MTFYCKVGLNFFNYIKELKTPNAQLQNDPVSGKKLNPKKEKKTDRYYFQFDGQT